MMDEKQFGLMMQELDQIQGNTAHTAEHLERIEENICCECEEVDADNARSLLLIVQNAIEAKLDAKPGWDRIGLIETVKEMIREAFQGVELMYLNE